MNSRNKSMVNLKKNCMIAVVIYILLVGSFYYLAGDQLHYRDSRGNIELPTAEAGTLELVQGTLVEQIFAVKIQRLESLSVQWGTYYRDNAGTVTMELLNNITGELLLSQEFDVSSITEGGLTTLTAEKPLENLYDTSLLVRLHSDSQPGSAISPLKNHSKQENWDLYLNRESAPGNLCLSVSGKDYIWTGLHYWVFASIGLGILLLLFLLVGWRKRAGHSYVVNALVAIKKYRFLIQQLVSRDFKTKYKRSVLGVFWSFLNPLLTMGVQYIVFSTLFKQDIENFPVYLLIGVVSFNFFNEACGMALSSIIGNAGLITKVYMPKYIYPLTRVMSSTVNLGISLIPLVLACLFTGVRFQKSGVLAVYFLICLIIFSLGLGMLLASSMVFFRDTQFLWGVLSMLWMYATPIFYPETILPKEIRGFLQLNPLYQFIKWERMCILDGLSPEPIVYVQCMLIAFAMLAVGTLVFCKTQDSFVLYL